MAKKNYSLLEVEVSKNFPTGISTNVDWEPRTNIIEAESSLIIEIELPGVDKEDVSVVLQSEREFIIKGQKKQPGSRKKTNVTYHLFEREFGSFYKKIIIDLPLDTNSIQSVMENGVLFLKVKKSKIKKIPIDIK